MEAPSAKKPHIEEPVEGANGEMMVNEPMEDGIATWDAMRDPFRHSLLFLPSKAVARLKLAAKGSSELASAFTEGRFDPFWLLPRQVGAYHPTSITSAAWAIPPLVRMFQKGALDHLRQLHISMDAVDQASRGAFLSALATLSPQLETLSLMDETNGREGPASVQFAWSALRNFATSHAVYHALRPLAVLSPPFPMLEYLKIDAAELPLNLKEDTPTLQQLSLLCDHVAFWNTVTLPSSLRVLHLTSAEPTALEYRHAKMIATCIETLESSDVSSGIEILSLDLPLAWNIAPLTGPKWPRLTKIRIQPFHLHVAVFRPVAAQLRQVVTLRANQFHPEPTRTKWPRSLYMFRIWKVGSWHAPVVVFYKYDTLKENRTAALHVIEQGQNSLVHCPPKRASEVLRTMDGPGMENLLQLEDSRSPMVFPYDRIGTTAAGSPQ